VIDRNLNVGADNPSHMDAGRPSATASCHERSADSGATIGPWQDRRPFLNSPPRTDISLPTLLTATLLSASLWAGIYWLWRAL
jgi:hypothetical protein